MRLLAGCRWRTLLTAVVLASASLGLQASDPQSEREQAQAQLEALQHSISERQQQIQRRQQRLSRSERELRELEQQVQQASRQLQQTERRLGSIREQISELETEQDELAKQLQTQAELLADQIETAYRTGDQSFLKMLLNQESPARVERLIAYFRYLNDARLEQLDKLHALEDQLAEVRRELDSQQDELAATQSRQERDRNQLASKQREQEQLVARLAREQESDEAQLQAMRQQEEELNELLEALASVLQDQDIQLDGLAGLRGQLSWPVQGSFRHRYGAQRSGNIRWRGVVMNIAEESEVSAIADGRVIFSDWLKGFGLVIVLDHGEGYMSLYGYNQALLREPGEAVRRGDTLALSGRSGGQREPGLYFEIRHRGDPVNPGPYMR